MKGIFNTKLAYVVNSDTETYQICISDIDGKNVKDKNEWTKEVKRGAKIDKVLMEVKRTNSIALQEKYKIKYPQCMTNYNSKEHKEYNEIIHQNFGGNTNDIDFQDDKILRRVSKYIEIDKNKNK